VLLLALTACRFQDLTPGGTRRDEAAAQTVVSSFYESIGTRNMEAMQRVSLPPATALLSGDHSPPVLVPMRTMIDVPEQRNQGGGVRVTRTEFRADGDVAMDRVVVLSRSGDGRRELEATDVVTLARRDGQWRVAHVVFGPWKLRSAP